MEALTTLFAELEESHRLLIDKADPAAVPTSKKQFEEEIRPKPDDFEKALRQAELFLNESQEVVMWQMWEEMNHAINVIQQNKLWDVEASNTDMSDWEGKEEGYIYFDLNEAYEEAREVLKKEINQPIREFES